MQQCRIPLLATWAAAALALGAGGVLAADYYVTPAGAGDYGGTNWHNAYSNVQTAASLATNADDRIYLQWGVYSNASQVVISNAPNVTFRGGCRGLSGGISNDYSGTNSTLTKTGGVMRIVYACDSTVTLSGVTVSNGLFTNGANFGAGLLFTNCNAMLTNCVVRDNTNICTSTSYGGGVYAAGGSLTLADCAFYNNTLQCSSTYGYGGAIAAVNCPLVARGSGSVFSNNCILSGNDGGAIFASGSDLTLNDIAFVGNYVSSSSRTVDGGAVCHAGSGMAAISGCRFATNWLATTGVDASGGAVYLGGATGVVANCVFTNNYANGGGNNAFGGGLCALGLRSLQSISNIFQSHRVIGQYSGRQFGGAVVIKGCSNAVVDSCTMENGNIAVGLAPELAYVTGCLSARFVNSILRNNNAGCGLNVIGGAGSTLGMDNCQVTGHVGNGLDFTGAGSALTMTNCLLADNLGKGLNYVGNGGSTLGVNSCLALDNSDNGLALSNGVASVFNCVLARNIQDGIDVAAGTVTVANCTLADNSGWGFSRSGGNGMVVNSIAWGNLSGGIMSNENVWVDYSCLQAPAFGGASNACGNPLFAPVAGCYYLSVSGLTGQAATSPCLDRGSNTAAFWGLTNRTTRTDGTNDNGMVDLGYHYVAGVSTSVIRTISNCYVDAVNGNDASNGLSWASAWKSLTQALSNVAANATINVATGIYHAAGGEVFPLTVQMPNLTLAASNADSALTVVDNAGTNGQNVLQALGMGTVVLRGLTFRGGRFETGRNNGAGLLFQVCAATLTNCVVRDNTNICTSTSYGGGVYAAGGSLTLVDCAFYNNTLQCSSTYGYGGAIAAVNCPLIARGAGSMFSNNVILSGNDGGAIYASAGDLTLDNIAFVGNYVSSSGRTVDGGAICHAGSGMAAISGCRFATNWLATTGVDASGGAVYLGGATGVVANCVFTNNYANGGGNNAFGGGLCALGLRSLQSISNIFQSHRVIGQYSGRQFGGAVVIKGCSNAVVDSCTMENGNIAVGLAPELAYVTGCLSARFVNSILRNNNAGCGLNVIGGAGSTLGVSNCLIVKNGSSGLYLTAGTATVVNCTLADNIGWGIARPTTAGLTVKNSVFWGNTLGGMGHNQNLTLTFTDAQDGWAAGLGAGNFSANPLFVNPAGGDYHEQGVEGSYHNGAWEPDGRNSPCLDAGDPASDWSLEPKPCGNRINAGAYGNTAEATRSLPRSGTVLRVW